jgi:hypothetical protein
VKDKNFQEVIKRFGGLRKFVDAHSDTIEWGSGAGGKDVVRATRSRRSAAPVAEGWTQVQPQSSSPARRTQASSPQQRSLARPAPTPLMPKTVRIGVTNSQRGIDLLQRTAENEAILVPCLQQFATRGKLLTVDLWVNQPRSVSAVR